MSVQVKHRRDTAANNATFTGAQGELVVDTTNTIPRLHDGSTAGGFPVAMATRHAVSDAAYTGLVTDRLIAYITLTAARVVSLPAASLYPTGAWLVVVDETGLCSPTLTITLSRNGSDTINGGTSVVLNGPYAAVIIESNGSNAWTIVDRQLAGYATVRTTVNDAAYTILPTDREVAYTAITAARVLSLPTASSYPVGTILWMVDESGSCSASKTISATPHGTDTINGVNSAIVLNAAFAYLALESNGSTAWTMLGRWAGTMAQQNASAVAITGGTIDGTVVGGTTPAAGSVTAPSAGDSSARAISSAWYGQNYLGGFINKFRNGGMDVWQRGISALAVGATTVSAYTADGWMVAATYSSGAGPVISQTTGRLLTKNSLLITGASNVTDVKLRQRIESLIAASLCSQTVTVQAQIYNNTGGSITPTLTVTRATAGADNYSSGSPDINAVSLQACANTAWTKVAYTFSANVASYNGLEIMFDFGNNLASGQSVQITELDIRVTPGVATGQNSNPPSPELRPITLEQAACFRYYLLLNQGLGFAFSTTAATFVFPLVIPMRATPSVAPSAALQIVQPGVANYTQSSASTGLAGLGDSAFGVSVNLLNFTGLTPSASYLLNFNSGQKITLSSEL